MNAVAEKLPGFLNPSWKTLGLGAAALTAVLYATSGDTSFKNAFTKAKAEVQAVTAQAQPTAPARHAASTTDPNTPIPAAHPNWLRRNSMVQSGPVTVGATIAANQNTNALAAAAAQRMGAPQGAAAQNAGATLPYASSPIQQTGANIRTPRTFTFLYNEASIRDAQTDSRKGNTIRIVHDQIKPDGTGGNPVLIAPLKLMRTFSDKEIENLFDAATTAGVGGYIRVQDTDNWYADGKQDFAMPTALWARSNERNQIIVILKDAFQEVKGGDNKLITVHNTGTNGPRMGKVDGFTFDLKDPKFQNVRVEGLDLVN